MTGAEKNKLFPTDIGMLVTDYLAEHFAAILDYNFTAKVEKEFDEIAEGDLDWRRMLAGFYEPFHEHVDDAEGDTEYVRSERLLGWIRRRERMFMRGWGSSVRWSSWGIRRRPRKGRGRLPNRRRRRNRGMLRC